MWITWITWKIAISVFGEIRFKLLLKIHCYCCLFMLRDVSLYHKLTKPLFCQHWAFSLNGIMQITHKKKKKEKKLSLLSFFVKEKKFCASSTVSCYWYTLSANAIVFVSKWEKFEHFIFRTLAFSPLLFFSYEFYAWTGKFSVCSVARRHKIVALLLLLALSTLASNTKHKQTLNSFLVETFPLCSMFNWEKYKKNIAKMKFLFFFIKPQKNSIPGSHH